MARSAISAEQLKIPPKPCGKMTAAGLFCVFGRVWGGSMHRAKKRRCPALQYMQTVRGTEQNSPPESGGFFMTERMGVLSSDGRCLQPSPLAARAMLRPAARRLAAVLRASTCVDAGVSPPSRAAMLRLMVLSPYCSKRGSPSAISSQRQRSKSISRGALRQMVPSSRLSSARSRPARSFSPSLPFT